MKKMLGLVLSVALLAVGGICATEGGKNLQDNVSLEAVTKANDEATQIRANAKADVERFVSDARAEAERVKNDAATASEAKQREANDKAADLINKAELNAKAKEDAAESKAQGIINAAESKAKRLSSGGVTGTLSRSWNRAKDTTGQAWEASKVKFNEGCDFVGTNWKANTYYVRPVTYTATGLIVVAGIVKLVKVVKDKMNQLEEEERANQYNQ